jgi:hypothetical protein
LSCAEGLNALCIKFRPLTHFLLFLGEHEADPQGDIEGDGDQLNPPSTPDHCHDDDDGTTALWHQLRKFQWLSQLPSPVGIQILDYQILNGPFKRSPGN